MTLFDRVMQAFERTRNKYRNALEQKNKAAARKFRAGSKAVMTFEERQEFIKNSEYGKLTGLADLLLEEAKENEDKVAPGWDAPKTITLSPKATEAFLRDVENPPKPTQALVDGMRDYWENSLKAEMEIDEIEENEE